MTGTKKGSHTSRDSREWKFCSALLELSRGVCVATYCAARGLGLRARCGRRAARRGRVASFFLYFPTGRPIHIRLAVRYFVCGRLTGRHEAGRGGGSRAAL